MYEKGLVSLVVGIYNGSNYLKQCIESIINQSYKQLEIILIDDGSTDDSLSIIKKYENNDSRIKVISQINHGVSYSRNLGLKLSKGEFFGVIDQDDILHPDYVKYFVDLLNITNADIATSKVLKSFAGEIQTIGKINEEYKVVDGIDAAKDMLLSKLHIGPWNKLIRKQLIINNNIKFNESFYCGEGFAFSVECFQASNKVVIGNSEVYFYRIDNATSGTSFFSTKKMNSSLNAQKYMYEKIIDKNKSIDRIMKFSYWRTCTDNYITLWLSKNKDEFKNEMLYLKKECHRKAIYALVVRTSFKQKIRALFFMISSTFASFIICKHMRKKTNNKYEK